MSLAIANGLTVLNVAKSLHSYPSHGYLLHRVALALAFRSIWGQLEACGPVGGVLASFGRFLSKASSSVRRLKGRRNHKQLREWEAEGAIKGILCFYPPERHNDGEDYIGSNDDFTIVSFLDAFENVELRELLLQQSKICPKSHWQPYQADVDGFNIWLATKP
jgi:hypothetical protein